MKHSYLSSLNLAPRMYSVKFDPSLWRAHRYLLWILITSLGALAAYDVTTFTVVRAFTSLVLPIVAIVYLTCRASIRSTGEGKHRNTAPHCYDERQPSGDPTLDVNEEVFRSAFDHGAGTALVALDGQWLKVNRSLREALGFSERELSTGSFHDITHPDDLGVILPQIHKLFDGNTSVYQVEQRYIHKLGHPVWFLLSVSLVRNAQAQPAYFVFQMQDITDRKEAEDRLAHSVFHDTLTGLPNRALFLDRLKVATERARRRKNQVFAVLFLDLDRFKVINDSLGHMVGDQLLIEIAGRLKTCLRSTDTSARLGGDEFTILLEDLNDHSESIHVVERIQSELTRPFMLGVHEVSVTASIGVAYSKGDYELAEDILRDADSAMYCAKTAGKARYEVFDKHRYATPSAFLLLEKDLARAVERHEVVLHYQPIVSLATGEVRGFEALVRWRHPQRGLISPIEFIPVAEDTGLIVAIGRWVLYEACHQVRQWQEQFPLHRSLSISVNLSAKQFMQRDLISQIIQTLEETDLDPRNLKLEITESVVMENIGTAILMLQQLRALGVELAIDDFGTGYSSLSYLHRLPVNSLKIDRSFVVGLARNNDNSEIVKTIVTLARSLKMGVVAEGVETMEQLGQLRLLQCEAGQGYLFSKPVDAALAQTLLQQNAHWQASIATLDDAPQRRAVGDLSPNHAVERPARRRALLRAVGG